MRINRIVIISTIISVIITGCATRPAIRKIKPPVIAEITVEETSKPVALSEPQKEFKVGEFHKFQMRWLGAPVGYVTYVIEREDVVKGRDVYVVSINVRTNDFASRIYKIVDKYTSYIDKEKLIPLRYDVDRSEGRYRKRATTYFDHENGKAYFENFLDGSKKTYEIPNGVLDPVSSILKARTVDIAVGKELVFNIANNEKVYNLFAMMERKEWIELPELGSFEAFFMAPYAILRGKRVRKGKVCGYISCDDQRILLYAEARAPLFTKLTATLVAQEK